MPAIMTQEHRFCELRQMQNTGYQRTVRFYVNLSAVTNPGHQLLL